MPNYFTVTRNPIARAGIIRKLMTKGYSLYGKYTVSDYFQKWPANAWPVVCVRFDGEFANKPTIDLMPHIKYAMQRRGAVQVSPRQISSIPDTTQAVEPQPQHIPPAFPSAAKYSITYMKADGSIGNYTISNPIEANNDVITAYAFGRGIRTFKKARVRSFSKVD